MINIDIFDGGRIVTYGTAVADSVLFEKIHFNFPAEWDGFAKTAVFTNGETKISVVLNENGKLCTGENECCIPHEVIKAPAFTVSVFGVSGDKRATTQIAQVSVKPSGYGEGATPAEPTPTEYEQLVAIANSAEQLAQSVRSDADSGAFKGDKGDTGAPGVAGGQGTPGSKVTIDPETGEWLIDKKGTGWYAKATDGHSPYIADGTNGDKGYWYFWDDKANDGKGGFVKGDKAQGDRGEVTEGTNGKSPYIEDGYWYYYDDAAGKFVKGSQAAGTDGVSPFIDEDGYWCYWDINAVNEDGTKGKLVRGDYAQTSVYVVEAADRPAWELHVGALNEDGTYTDKTIILPTADKLSSMTVVSIADGKISEGMSEVTMYYGILAKGTTVKFHNVTYGSTEKATTLVGANSSVMHALINPVSVDFSEYPVELINSHGEVCYTVLSKEKNLSENPLTTRADGEKKWNQGIYDLTVSLIADKAADNNLNNKAIAYALRAKDAWGNNIISNYDVKVIAKNEALDITNKEVDVVYTSSAKLDELFAAELSKVAAHYYSIEKADLEAIGAVFDEATNTISSPTKQGTIEVKVNYLKTDGTKVEGGNAKTFTVNFTYDTGADITIADAVVWNLTKGADATDPSNNTSDLVVNSTDDLFAILNKEFTGKKKPTVRLKSIGFAAGDKISVNGNEYAYESGSIDLVGAQPVTITDNKGKVTGYKIAFQFNPTMVAAVMHNAVLEIINPDYQPT